jgi:hypothetical protein
MKLLEKTKENIGRFVLSKRLGSKKRITQVCSIDGAKRVGILYNATHPVSFEIIKTFAKVLMQKKIDVTVLGYVHDKNLIDHYLYRKGFDFFTKTNLNWYNKPVSNSVEEFIKNPFDILINLCLEETYPVKYILALSNSKFKVGKYFDEPNYMDLMIDIEKEKKAMKELSIEIDKESKIKKPKSDIEIEIEEKVDIEIQLNFLINQIMHYLTIIKSN